MISFYPGPSKVHEEVPLYVSKAYKKGVVSINHRSEEFTVIFGNTIRLLKKRLLIPEDYLISFTSSATECWEIIAQSLIRRKSYHIYNGAFGEKWFRHTTRLKPEADYHNFDMQQPLSIEQLKISDDHEIICLTQNETSNATQLSNAMIKKLRERYPNHLIAVDATSSLAGINLQIEHADIWYASVQKCFGIPAGFGVLILSPRAVNKALDINEKDHYNSLPSIIEKARINQTTHTPNVLGIYLLMSVLRKRNKINDIDKKIRKRCNTWISFLEKFGDFELLIKDPAIRSTTVIAIESSESTIDKIRKSSREAGFVLGNGYGALKPTTLRIANFPALRDIEISKLKDFFQSNFN